MSISTIKMQSFDDYYIPKLNSICNTNNKYRKTTLIRQSLIKKYGKCVITGWSNPSEYQSAHIVPKSIGYSIGFDRVNDDSNCMLLTNSLHTIFDEMGWTIDIYRFLDDNINDNHSFKATMIIKDPPKLGTSMLCEYVDKTFTLPIVYLPSLYLHYHCYLQYNYTKGHTLEELFRHHIMSPVYQELSKLKTTSEFKRYFLMKRSKSKYHPVSVISDYRKPNLYKVIWDYWGQSHNTWEPYLNINNTEAFTNWQSFIDS